MSDISELETRITTALERISAGVDALAPTKAEQSGEVAQLTAALEDERTANAQLEERVKAIKEKQDSTVQTLSEEVERLTKLLADEERALAKLRQVNANLRTNNDALREAVSQGAAEPHLINKSMMAELEGLRATQSADRNELDAVLGELNSLIAQAQSNTVQSKENVDA
ncbi:hypothetical protein O2N63_07550 [Aliiroseovarius sp. KMU-50]|uniref:Colicin transporter n=1 Tax=Aliiroseovarius salicola TaxID=3009082 RepID=A0ABT4W1U1_9RHOB|nr:hypothetical protein [Aliiroseovarius sp. KMU-50]MDA5093940.1 hypothetical protein [Aliiroseovarius sp. KMU-50]